MTSLSMKLLASLSLAALPLAPAPALAQDVAGALSAARIAACAGDRQADGCATVLIRVFVCEQAAAMVGCEEINEMAEQAALEVEEENEPDEVHVEVRAEGELGDPDEVEPMVDEDRDAEAERHTD